ncbi:MAG: DnaJ domain-containing protein [Leptolyngbyaceae cyanobacterium bins.349]|nr:DnaJ domain-containing protein [Leptolyngbyaceae cyanobacterium bins.349]
MEKSIGDPSGEAGVNQERETPNRGRTQNSHQNVLSESYYALLGLHPSASVREIRQAYRDLSKLYHPDTTTLPTSIATTKFQQLNEAYATLSNPERRNGYDRKIGYSTVAVVQPLPSLQRQASRTPSNSSSAYLDATDRPLSPGEIFALFILGLTFLGCLLLAIAIGLTRGETALQPVVTTPPVAPQIVISGSGPKAMTLDPHPAGQTVPPPPTFAAPVQPVAPANPVAPVQPMAPANSRPAPTASSAPVSQPTS